MATIPSFESHADLTGHADLYIAIAEGKGRGVFAAKAFKKGEIIERCCIIELDRRDHHKIAGTILEHYVYLWDKRKKSLGLALGFGSLYNHSPQANCRYSREVKTKIMTYRATKDILPGEEIMINYGPAGESFNSKTT